VPYPGVIKLHVFELGSVWPWTKEGLGQTADLSSKIPIISSVIWGAPIVVLLAQRLMRPESRGAGGSVWGMSDMATVWSLIPYSSPLTARHRPPAPTTMGLSEIHGQNAGRGGNEGASQG